MASSNAALAQFIGSIAGRYSGYGRPGTHVQSVAPMPPKKGGTKALGGLTLARAIGPQDIKLLNKLASDSVGVWDLLEHRAHQ